MNKKNNQTTLINVKFDEESESELWIRLQDNEMPENAEICRKNKFFFSAGSIFFPYSQHVKVPIKTGFKDVPLKQHFGEIFLPLNAP